MFWVSHDSIIGQLLRGRSKGKEIERKNESESSMGIKIFNEAKSLHLLSILTFPWIRKRERGEQNVDQYDVE